MSAASMCRSWLVLRSDGSAALCALAVRSREELVWPMPWWQRNRLFRDLFEHVAVSFGIDGTDELYLEASDSGVNVSHVPEEGNDGVGCALGRQRNRRDVLVERRVCNLAAFADCFAYGLL